MRADAASHRRLLGWCLLVGLAIRIWLSLTSFCVSGDGPAYIGMARSFADGDWRTPLGAVFSPLYPLLMAGMHRLIPDWEINGNLLSAILGTGAIGSIYLLTKEVFADSKIALGAAALTAIHPDLAALSASVRTEAGYIFFTTLAVWLILRATREGSLPLAAGAGAVVGLAYLYRTEAVGLILLNAIFPALSALLWQRDRFARSIVLGLVSLAAASALVAPYVFFLHAATGHWTIGRELDVVILLGLGAASPNKSHFESFAFSAHVSPLTELMSHPRLYLSKVREDLVDSFYNLLQAEGPLVAILLAIGLWKRGRRLFRNPAEAFLLFLVLSYFGGFALTRTGTRFLIHLIPYTFGWVIIGLAALTEYIQTLGDSLSWLVPELLPAAVLALILLPQALWPIGYDMRGARYAGEEIARRNAHAGSVIARDGRVAWYANAHFLALPTSKVTSFCDWLAAQNNPGYVLIGEHDERQFGITPRTSCLGFIKRYPRYGSGYYDLYAVEHHGAAS